MMRSVAKSAAAALILLSCSTGPKRELFENRTDQILPLEIHVRRPQGMSANPNAEPEDDDWVSDPLPDARLDCRPVETLNEEGIDFKLLRTCLDSVITETVAEYHIEGKAQPEAALDPEDEEVPRCLRGALPKFAIPREIFFLAPRAGAPKDQKGQLDCYAARLPVEKSDFMGLFEYGGYSASLMLRFPVGKVPRDDAEMRRMLTAWRLTPFFWLEDNERVVAKLVPMSLCKECMGENAVRRALRAKPVPLWPRPEIEPIPSPGVSPSPSPSPSASASPTPTPRKL
jgi:hypothetical protein